MTSATTREAAAAASGGWITLSSTTRLLALGDSPDREAIAALWSAIGGDDGLQRTLDLLTSRGLSATPPFALLDWTTPDDTLRVIVRGGVNLTVTHATGDELLGGAGVSTWIERSIDGVSAVALTVTGAVAAPVPALPLELGAAWVAGLAIGFGASTVSAPKPAAVETAAPVTGPVAAPAEEPAAESAVEPPAEPVAQEAEVEIDIEATVSDAPVSETTGAEPPVAPAIENLETSPDGYDYLFGDTMYRSVADAAVREDVEGEDAAAEAPAASPGDHDGHTVLTSDIAKLRGRRNKKTPADAPPPAPAAVAVALVLANGTREPLTQPILVGRSPSVSQVSGGKLPRLITVGGADQDISRTHVRFALEGGTVVVTDLHSRNGTTVAMPGKEPQKLRAGEPTSVIVGTVVDLGGGVTFTVDEAGL